MCAIVRILALGLVLVSLSACAARRAADPAPVPAAPAEASADDAPRIHEVRIEGAAAFPRAAILRYTRLKEGSRLRRTPGEVAHALQERYRIQGYLAAQVSATFDPTSGVFTFTVDEGRLAEVVLEGVEGKTADTARAELALAPGGVLREKDVRGALARLEDRSAGALSRAEPAYLVDRGPLGPRLTLRLVRNRARVAFRPEGPDLSPLSNRVEGFAPGAGVGLTVFDTAAFNHADLYARAGYGLSSEEARYAVGARRPFGSNQLFVLGAEVHDLTDTDDHFRKGLLSQGRGRTLSFSITEDYFRRKGYEAYAFLRASPRVHLGLSYRHDDYESLEVEKDDSVFFFARRPRPNPAVDEGRLQSVVATARFTSGLELFDGWTEERESFLVKDAYGGRFERAQGFRAEATFEASVGGPFSFRRLIGQVRGSRDLGARQVLRARVLAGLTDGAPPLQKRFALGGAGTLRGYALKEFAGEDIVLGTVEWGYTPHSRYPSFLLFYDGGRAFTDAPPSRGWRDDVGFGLEWPGGGRAFLRVDVGFPLRPSAGADRARVHAVMRLPF